ncbi:MAG: PD-(D/E)XK nuclease family protein [Candidatus Ventricola sp.]
MRIVTARPHRLLGEIVERIGALAGEGKRCMLLVPSQFTLQAEIEVMARLNLTGTFLIDVLSPGRLQGRVFERAGQPDRVIFDERGKCMVLSGIIEEEKENLTVYRSAAENGALGLAKKLSALIADFKRSGKTAQEILLSLRAMDDAQRARPSAKKLADAAHIYAIYEEKMRGKLCDAEDVSQEMLDRMERSGVLHGQNLFVYGFDMITPAFAGELVQMAALADSLTLAVETDDNGAPDGRLFAPVNFSIDRLCALAAERGVQVSRERVEQPLSAPQDIQLLERALFALGAPASQEAPAHIELHAVSSMLQEVHLAGSRIRRMMAAGEDTAQMAVVYPRESGYAPLLAGVLPLYGVSAYIAEKRAAGAHPLCRFVTASLAVVSGGWRASDVVEVVQSGFIRLEQEEADALCAYIEGMDVRGEAIRRPFAYVRDGGEEALEKLNASRERVVAPLAALQRALRRAKDADETIAAILSLLEEVYALETLEAQRAALTEAGLMSEAEDCAQVWNRLMETLDQLHTLLGEGKAPTKVVLGLLESGLSALELSALPPADGSVICGEIGNVRTGEVKTLFALGMNDSQGASGGGLFTPQEQEEAERETGAYLGMSPAERAALSQLDELKTLTGCTERLIVSYALADETGRALREGAAVQAMKRLFPAMPVYGGVASHEREAMLCAPDSALEALSVALSAEADGGEKLSEAYAQAYAALNQSGQGREKLLGVTRGLGSGAQKRLDGAQARALYGRPVMSVSRLETFAQCPYRHFIRYGLSPRDALKPGVDRAELGTLYHEAAERFTRAVTSLPQFPDVDEATCDALMAQAVEPLIEDWRKSPLGESARGAAIARRIGSTARRAARSIVSQYAQSRFTPLRFEMVFGQNGVAPIMLELADGTFVYLQGRIDRIDVLDGETKRIRVIDYKSGTKKFDPTMAYYGIQLQLLLYLAAAMAQMPGAQAAGFFYCRIADPTVKTESRVKEEVERQIARKLSLAGVSLADVEVLRAQDERHAAMITREGKPSGLYRASMTDEAGMDAMLAFAKNKATALAGDAYAGVIDDAPAAYGTYSACASCDYSAVCGFDPTVKKRRRLSKKSVEDLK